jgi:hypothetical protein
MSCKGVISVRIALLAEKAEIVFDGEDINEDEIIGMNRCTYMLHMFIYTHYFESNVYVYVYIQLCLMVKILMKMKL